MPHSLKSSRSTGTEVFPDLAVSPSSPVPPSPSHLAPERAVSGDISTAASAPPALNLPRSPTEHRVRYSPGLTSDAAASTGARPHSDSRLSNLSAQSPNQLRRRETRSNTFRTVDEFDDYGDLVEHKGWRPGAEPGIDPLKADGGHPGSMPDLHATCQVTVVDFSQTQLEIIEMDNAELVEFIQQPQPEWVKCRWINVNGLSWDVIQALGRNKELHRLAIEDVMNTRNRTKVDWYSNHAFLVMSCQKLVRVLNDDSDSSSSESSDDDSDIRSETKSNSSHQGKFKRMTRRARRWASAKREQHPTGASVLEKGNIRLQQQGMNANFSQKATRARDAFNPHTLTTLHRYHASANEARTEYFEKHSALATRGMAVMAEQVSMFITSDNTVIAFFEQSADDVESPILARLNSPTTILRQSCDASMVAQAIIDAIIDMAIPVTACYADVVGDLELDVLTHPGLKQTKKLYIIISEINKLYSFVNPILTLIGALRDHKSKLTGAELENQLQNPLHGVIISPMTYTYLGDVYDHAVLITENLNQIKESANHMIDLIFNTIATYQNESMKQLTAATILFLPMTFITGYFGQNFEKFQPIQGSVVYL